MPGSTGTCSVSPGNAGGVEAGALSGGGHGHHLGGAEHLAKALVLREVEGALAAVVEMGEEHGAAVGESELVAAEGRNAAGIGGSGVVKVVARVEGGVAHKLKERSVKAAGAGAGDDVGETGGAAADLGGHPAGAGLDLLDRVHVEVGEGGAAHLGVADVGAVHGEGGLNAALAVDGELLREVGGAVGVGHGAGGQQEQLAEVALVERQLADGLAGELLAAGGAGLRGRCGDGELAARKREVGERSILRDCDRRRIFDCAVANLNGEFVLPGG